jgi:hypothetical protein
MLAVREHCELVEVFGQAGAAFRDMNKAALDDRSLRVHARRLIAGRLVARNAMTAIGDQSSGKARRRSFPRCDVSPQRPNRRSILRNGFRELGHRASAGSHRDLCKFRVKIVKPKHNSEREIRSRDSGKHQSSEWVRNSRSSTRLQMRWPAVMWISPEGCSANVPKRAYGRRLYRQDRRRDDRALRSVPPCPAGAPEAQDLPLEHPLISCNRCRSRSAPSCRSSARSPPPGRGRN